MSVLEVNPARGCLFVEDDAGKTLGVMVTTSGQVAVTHPSGTPGKVLALVRLDRSDAREFARGILALIGEEDA